MPSTRSATGCPTIHPDAYVHPDAVVIGDVAHRRRLDDLADRGAPRRLRDDPHRRAHVDPGRHRDPRHRERRHLVGDDCVIGHIVHLEACKVEEPLSHRQRLGPPRGGGRAGRTLVGSAALVPEGMEVPSATMALGVPARIREKAPDAAHIALTVGRYVERAQRFRDGLRRLD